MIRPKVLEAVSFIVFALCLVVLNGSAALAQEESAPTTGASSAQARDEPDYDVQLDLVVASNTAAEKGSLPQPLDATIRQLRTSLPFAHYRLATTFLNRVKAGGTLEARGVGNFLITTSIGPNTPTIYSYTFYQVKQDTNTRGQTFIRIARFKFDLRMPILTSTTLSGASNASSPVINYESLGMSTEVGVREGTPSLIGTLATGRADELLLLLVSVKQIAPR